MPTTTAAEVQTSVTRWRASDSSAIERCTRAALNITKASQPLKAELMIDNPSPQPSCSSGCGESSRSTATQMMAIAAPMIRIPSNPDEKYSALWWPYGCSSSAGRDATVTIASAKVALARFTNDSMASEISPMELVT